MTGNRLFFTSASLARWIREGRAVLTDDGLTTHQPDGVFRLDPAVRFVGEITEGRAEHDLIGKVKDLDQLHALGAEHLGDYVLLGQTAYAVQEGLVATRRSSSTPPSRPRVGAQTIASLQAFLLDRGPQRG